MKKTALISLLVLTMAFSFGCRTKTPESAETPETVKPTTPITTEKMKLIPEKGDTIAIMTTNHGEIKILLYTDKAPETTKNFIELSKEGKYDGTIFHRVIEDFMIQGGDFEKRNGTGGHSYKGPDTYIQDEFGEGLTHARGALSMANAGPNTGGSQFFIVHAKEGTARLDGKHAIFGYVYDGMDTVDKIAGVETGPGDKPMKDAVIEKMEITTFLIHQTP